MSAFADLVRFRTTAGGTTDWVVSTAIGGCQIPSAANVINATSYKVYAVSDDLTQWEISTGAYNSGTTTFPRTTVLYNSSGTGTATGQSGAGTKINFTLAPQVSVVALAEDLIQIEIANSFTSTQKQQIQSNIFVKAPTTQTLTSGSGATYTTPTGCLWLEVYIVGGGGGGGGAPNSGTTLIAGSDGSASTFNSINANPGKGATTFTQATALGGTGGTGSATRRIPGSPGGGSSASSVVAVYTGAGGNSWFANGGGAIPAVPTAAGIAGATNSGGGGSGGTNGTGTNDNVGSGGGGGETAYLIINSPAATYTYTVGGGGNGGSSSSSGGAGGSGVIFVIEHYS